jgi:hypothetical protein
MTDQDRLCINTIRMVSVDVVQPANFRASRQATRYCGDVLARKPRNPSPAENRHVKAGGMFTTAQATVD